MKHIGQIVAATLTAGMLVTPALAINDAERCEAGKNKLAGKYASCRQDAESLAIKMVMQPDYSKCDEKFSARWVKIEDSAGGLCTTNEDDVTIQSCVMAHSEKVAAALAGGVCASGGLPATGQKQCANGGTLGGCSGVPVGQDADIQAGFEPTFVDNGDGTTIDAVTGLMWEKLSNDESIHNKDAVYSWSNAMMIKIDLLNSTSFAGYSDWRMPNVKELQSIVNFGADYPAAFPAFHTECVEGCSVLECSCTVSSGYWASTSYQNYPSLGWYVSFDDGHTYAYDKSFNYSVRAVRGGF